MCIKHGRDNNIVIIIIIVILIVITAQLNVILYTVIAIINWSSSAFFPYLYFP